MGKRMLDLQLANLGMSRMASRDCAQTKSDRSNNRILMLIGQINANHLAEPSEPIFFALAALSRVLKTSTSFQGRIFSRALATSPSSAWATWEAPRSIRFRAAAPTLGGSIR